MTRKIASLFLLSIGLFACAQDNNSIEQPKDSTKKDLSTLSTAYFASGCFWCVEAVFESVNGVEEVVSGYSGGSENDPSYEEVSAGLTGHAEAVKVYYDSSQVSFETLAHVFFNSHDPSTPNQQGPDKGRQYRSIAFYGNKEEKQSIQAVVDSLLTHKVYTKISTEILSNAPFYSAEDYHQDFKSKNPNHPYVKAVSMPRLNDFKRKMPQVLKAN
jgi:peptide-methionine (S)-S-oxide reductase